MSTETELWVTGNARAVECVGTDRLRDFQVTCQQRVTQIWRDSSGRLFPFCPRHSQPPHTATMTFVRDATDQDRRSAPGP
jgi:hypothetical protein